MLIQTFKKHIKSKKTGGINNVKCDKKQKEMNFLL